MRRARLKYQPRIYALDLRFNNATENQYLIKQMMEKNTAREMRLLHCLQTSQSQRRDWVGRMDWWLGWQENLACRQLQVPLIPILLSLGWLAIFIKGLTQNYNESDMRYLVERRQMGNRASLQLAIQDCPDPCERASKVHNQFGEMEGGGWA